MVIGTDKSDPQLKISAQNIKSSSDLSGELFCCPFHKGNKKTLPGIFQSS
jgi:hypothetical protein